MIVPHGGLVRCVEMNEGALVGFIKSCKRLKPSGKMLKDWRVCDTAACANTSGLVVGMLFDSNDLSDVYV